MAFRDWLKSDKWMREYAHAIATPLRHEHSTKSYWARVLRHIFFETEFDVSSEVPPTGEPQNSRRADLAAQRMFRNGKRFQFLWGECAKGKVTPQKFREIEFSCRDLCVASNKDDNEEVCYAITVVGTSARIWRYDRSIPGPASTDMVTSLMSPCFGRALWGIRDEYVNLEDDNNTVIADYLRKIKEWCIAYDATTS